MKVTDFLVILFVITFSACSETESNEKLLAFQQEVDSLASKQIDSAYKVISKNCDTAFKYRLPILVDSLIRIDTTFRKDTLAK